MKLLFLLFKFAKLGKLLTTGGTMLLAVVLYAFVYGWRYAVGFLALMTYQLHQALEPASRF